MRRENLWLCVLLVVALVCLCGCPETRSGSVIEYLGVMGALDSEIELIKERMSLEDSSVVSGRRFYVGEVEGHEVVLVKAGVGKVNAAMTAQLMIDKFGVRRIVFTGIAGGIAPDLYVGDVVISSKVIQHDYGLVSKDGFQPWQIGVGDSSGREVPVKWFDPDTQLVTIAFSAAQDLDFPVPDTTMSGRVGDSVKVYLGCIVTGDQFIASEEKRRWLEETFDAYATEMEGGAVAQVCVSNGVPFVVVRTLSDLANEDASVDIEKFFAYASRNSAMLVLEMLRLMH